MLWRGCNAFRCYLLLEEVISESKHPSQVLQLCHEYNLDFDRKEIFCLFPEIVNKMGSTELEFCFIVLFHLGLTTN